MQVDHKVPRRSKHHYKGDIDNLKNLMPSCRRCNHYKRAHTLRRFRELMVSLHERVEDHYINKVAIDYGIIKIAPFDGVFYFEKEDKE